MDTNKYGYIEPVILPTDYIHGDHMLGDVAIQPDGQWDSFLPDDSGELQNINFEHYCCASEGTLHAEETLEKRQFGNANTYSVRMLATVSGTGPAQGADPNVVAEKLRTGGCVLATDWPFAVVDYAAFYTMPPQNILQLAKAQFVNIAFGHSWLADTTPATMKGALTFSPLGVSVYAWAEPDTNGIYHRPPGATDCHWVTIYGYVDGQYWKCFDSYDQTHKKLAWDYGFGYAKRYTINKRVADTPNPTGWLNVPLFIQWMRHLLGLEGASFGAARSPKWEQVRKAFVALHPTCAVCNTSGTLVNQLNVHHIRPFHLHPELELDNSNLITLCRRDHYLMGHLLNWSSFNKDIPTDATLWMEKIENRP